MTEGGGSDAGDATGPPRDPDGDGVDAGTDPAESADGTSPDRASPDDADLVDRGRGWGSDPADPRDASHDQRDASNHPQDASHDRREAENDDGSIAGEFRPSDEIEPGDVDPEAIAFVGLGAILTVLAGAHLVGGALGLTAALVLTGVTGAIVGLLAAFLVFVGD